MGLSNSASRSRNYSSTVNQNQGGGSKKAGFPYIIGRTADTSRQLRDTNQPLKVYQTNLVFAHISHNIGRTVNGSYWRVHV